MNSSKSSHQTLLGMALICLALSAIQPYDFNTWLLEVFPVLIGIPLLVYTYDRFRLTGLLYTLLFIHAVILMVGGHYSYARVPVGYWVEHAFHFSRNHYDRLGHLAQGFVPAILAREILLRKTPLEKGGWLFLLVVCMCLAFSAFYELIEWWTSLVEGGRANDFLGTQGDIWDTQWDMFFALIGANLSLITMSKWHDRQLSFLSN